MFWNPLIILQLLADEHLSLLLEKIFSDKANVPSPGSRIFSPESKLELGGEVFKHDD